MAIGMTFAQNRGRQNAANNSRPGVSAPSQRPATPNSRPTPQPPPPASGQQPPNAAPRPNTPPGPTNVRPPQPPRPQMPPPPPHYNYYRPTPPPTWRPTPHAPSFNSILGIALGTMLSNSVNYLINNGYHVSGYNNNAIYLNNVMAYGVNWPNATMYYNNGYLQGSLFSTSTYSYDMSTYNYVYRNLMSAYGMPVSTQSLSNGGVSATWWGSNNSFVTLSFYPQPVQYGGLRYFTTVSTGN